MNKILFNENTRVKVPATMHLVKLGYKYVSYKESVEQNRIDIRTNIFIDQFKNALEKINSKDYNELEIEEILNNINESIKLNDLGKDFYTWLTNPVDRVKLIDFDNINNNTFSVVNELVFGEKIDGSFRPDINILVNGIPLAFLEVKIPNNDGGIQVEFDRMVNKRFENEKNRKFFNLIQLTLFSNNMNYETSENRLDEPKAGSFYSTPNGLKTTFNFFREEIEIKADRSLSELETNYILDDNNIDKSIIFNKEFLTNLDENSPCNKFVTSVLKPERMMFLIKYGIFYVDKNIREKHIMRYPQFFASLALIKKLDNGLRSGIIWHTQGSGKTALSIYLNKIISDYYAKKSIQTRFFYVVDRLDLLNQTKFEYSIRNFEAIGIDSKDKFLIELAKPISVSKSMVSLGSCTIVNIQKFSESLPENTNSYGHKVQRIFFVDEAHRSYSKSTGEFYKNLMLIDRDGIFIALTGTPLLNKKDRSVVRFGEYIHKYFFDKSILDGYTLKIKKEEIQTLTKTEIKRNLELEVKKNGKDLVTESDAYISSLSNYILEDFTNFRIVNNDNDVGGMIVCNSNSQAKKIQSWFEKTKIKTKIIISDEDIDSEDNKKNQTAFKDSKNGIDMLIVHLMLTTGYDADRLKKLYLLRKPKEHSLLQTISRVNRPYKNKQGKSYKYGYITDFVDITEEYDRTVQAYLKELEDELDLDEGSSVKTLLVDTNLIQEKYEKALNTLEGITETKNKEEFSMFLNQIIDKNQLYTIKNVLSEIRECKTEFLLSRADEKAKQIDNELINGMLGLVKSRISFLNLAESPLETIQLLGKDIVELIFDFIKIRTTILNIEIDLSKKNLPTNISKLAHAISSIKSYKDSRVVKLNVYLKEIMDKLQIIDFNNMQNIEDDILYAIKEAEEIAKENNYIKEKLNEEIAYVQSYFEITQNYENIDKKAILSFLSVVQNYMLQILKINEKIIESRTNFIDNIKKMATEYLINEDLYKKLELKQNYNTFLSIIFNNLQYTREG